VNHVYRVVFNHALKCVQVVSELACGGRAASSTAARRAPQLAALSTAIALGCLVPAAFAASPGWNEWRATIDNDWATPGNWQLGEPSAADPLARATYIDSNRTAIVGTTGEATNHIHVGDTGIGTLVIQGGGQLTSATIFMGTGEVAGTRGTADGRASISGAGSRWTALGTIGVGHWGKGLVDIDNGGTLAIGSDAYIASGLGAVGVVNVTGPASSFTTGATLLLGAGGNGTVNVADGARATAQYSRIGVNAGSVGRMDVSDGASWTTSRDITIGQGGTGTARLSTGATATAGTGLYVGSSATGVGTLEITNTGSRLDTGVAQMVFGDLGQATVTVSDGGRLSGGDAWLGNRIGGNGAVEITGANSAWESTMLKVGTNGTGSFLVDDGANAVVTGSVDLAMTGTSRGTITVGQNATLAVGGSSGGQVAIIAGAGQGLFELAGGTLRANSWLDLNSALVVSADSLLDVAGTLRATQAITGTGQLRKTGTGTLMLSGTNTWSGGLRVEQGTLSVGSNAALGTGTLSMADGTSLGLGSPITLGNDIALNGEVAVHVAPGNSVTLASGVRDASGDSLLVKNDSGTLVLGGSAYTGDTRIDGGTLLATGNALPTGDIEIGSDGTFAIDTTRVLDYAGQFSGSGTLRQGRHFLTLTGDSSAFTGTTVVNGGMLAVESALGGRVQMTNNALLAGNGSLGSVELLSGSVLSPGSRLSGSIGRLSISGDLLFDASATFQVDVAANGSSDFVGVGGKATLGNAGTVAVAAAGDWMPSTRYTLMTAGAGVDGTFAGVTSNFAFLDPTLSYDANNVYLTMARNDIALPDVALAFPEVVVNDNQREVATAVEALGDGSAVYDAVVRLEVPQVVPAFDSLSGEVHAATRGALLQNRFLHDGIDRHLDGRAMSSDIAPGVSVWLAGSGGQLRTDASAENAASRVQQHGLMAGAGWQVGESLELGVAAGQQQLDNRLRERAAVADTDATEYGVYAHYRWQGLSLRGGVTRADYRTDTTRTAQVGTAFGEQLLAREDATGTTAFVRAGWSFGGPRLQLTPEIELAQVRLESDGSQERGGDSALLLASGDSDYRTGLAALKADWDISGGLQDRAVVSARVGWQYADGDRLPTTTVRFVGGSQDFSVAGAPLARSSVLAQLGVAVSPSANSRVSLQVQGRDGDGQRDVGAQLDWSVAF
jgi:autotransporter-associated beta strand protein/T5SS/PEP-CTERM-associated repeat protein